MCLLTYQKEPIILKEDKVVWKVMKEEIAGKILTWFNNFYYTLNKLCKQPINIGDTVQAFDDPQYEMYIDEIDHKTYILKENVISIDKGFHAFTDKRLARKYAPIGSTYKFLYKCIIPAGSEYYEDETGLCVSNQIIIVEKVD